MIRGYSIGYTNWPEYGLALKPHDTHQAEYPMGGVHRQSYLPYIPSILQDRDVSDK